MPKQSKQARHLLKARSGAQNEKKWKARNYEAIRKRKFRKQVLWANMSCYFNSMRDSLKNPSGRSRGYEENMLVLLAINATMNRHLAAIDIGDVNWSQIELEVSTDFCIRLEYVQMLSKAIFQEEEEEKDDCWVVISFKEERNRGGAAEGKKIPVHQKVMPAMMQALAAFIDETHCRGSSVTARKVNAFFLTKFSLNLHRRTIGRKLDEMGLQWAPTKPLKRTIASYRREAVHNFLISLDKYVREMEAQQKEGKVSEKIFVFTDESYVHQGHAFLHSYLGEGIQVEKDNTKGKRLIILHAIMEYGPLATKDKFGNFVSDITWKGDTPHPVTHNNQHTCETLWVSSSSSGDYHDNMNSEMFMQWVEGRLIPTFNEKFPGKKMVLVLDNAPYHHKRAIGTLGAQSKGLLVSLMAQHQVEYIDLPIKCQARLDLFDKYPDADDRGECIRIPFDADEQKLCTSKTKNPHVGTTEELKVSFVTYLKGEKPELVECQIEGLLKQQGHEILWAPPYCPDLQPIELFWEAGKNHVAINHHDGQTMRETVRYLQEGWYGNKDAYLSSHLLHKKPVSCQKLWRTCRNIDGTKYVNLCVGLEGMIGDLKIDETYIPEDVTLPIDTLVVDLMSSRPDDEVELVHGDYPSEDALI